MRLKRLELYGFKSFATRTVFEFGEGITAIIGPNGSGKSNIADAIRWVFGEQSYRSLRAKTTGDMIFSGTGSRARMGLAEVLIVLDNSDGLIPLEFTEVVIGRRAHRSGENEYLLNGNKVRYRDILDVLEKAGLARSSYTVIGQGMVDAALSLRPEARRALFEEAAGITPHLRKREQSLSRIAETEQNLERAQDILQELEPRARRLARQAERAEAYRLLQQDLEELQRIWYGYQWRVRQQNLSQTQERLERAQNQLELQQTHSTEARDELARLQEKQDEQRRHIDELASRATALQERAEMFSREIAINQERARLYEQQKTGLQADIDGLETRRNALQTEIDASRAELARYTASFEESQRVLGAARSELVELDRQRSRLEKQANELERQLTRTNHDISQNHARLEQLDEQQEASSRDCTTAHSSIAQIARRETELEEKLDQLRAELAETTEQYNNALASRSKVETRLDELRQELREAQGSLTAQEKHKDQLVSRYDLLGRLRDEMTGYNPGVRHILGAESGLKGLRGTVANLIAVPSRYEQAIEAAMGSRLENIVADTWADAEAAIAELKRSGAGWATFLPLDTVKARSDLRIQAERGIVGVAKDLVSYDAELEPIASLLLGRVVIVDDLTTARNLLRQRTGASLIVTLGGETVQPTGAVSGGARKKRTNFLAQEREWRNLPAAIEQIDADINEASEQVRARQSALDEANNQLLSLEEQIRSLRDQANRQRQTVGECEADIREAVRDHNWHQNRLVQAEKELGNLADKRAHFSSELESLEASRVKHIQELEQVQNMLSTQDDEGLRARVAEMETHAAVAKRTIESQNALLSSHEQNMRQILEEHSAKTERLNSLHAEQTALGEATTAAHERLATHQENAAHVLSALEPARTELAELETKRREMETLRSQRMDRLHDAELRYNQTHLERDRAQDAVDALAEDIEADLGPVHLPGSTVQQLHLSLSDKVIELPVVETAPQGLSDQIRALRVRIKRLGNINPDAPEEYEETLQRQTFLESQAQDLRGAIATLYEVIDELDDVIQQDFGETVRLVDKNFGKYFTALFGGGNAKLILTNPDDIAETGVDIIAHPPGKKTQQLSLLSGGERALTAVALVFALLSANPVPFCCLDEVDAALDEANVQRFRKLLLEHADNTQFLVISHNRRTIEAATTIHGISMAERGVSQCLSLDLPPEQLEQMALKN